MGILDIAQVVSSFVIIISALAAGIWTLYRYKKLRELKKSLTMLIVPTVHFDDNISVLEIVIELTNSGTAPIFGNATSIPRCILRVRQLPRFNDGSLYIKLDDDQLNSIVEPIQYLSYFEHECILEPGVPCEVRGYALVSTSYQGLLLIQAEFVDTEDIWWTDWKIVNTRPKAAIN